MSQIRVRAFPYEDVRAIKSRQDFSDYLATRGLRSYASHCGGEDLGSALAVCSTETEASQFRPFPFDRITLSGVVPLSKVEPEIADDRRMSYRLENAEALTFPTDSFDLVFCKEGLHHLARPVLGLYEMLRVCRRAAIVIEPYESHLEHALERLGLATAYERRSSSFHIDETGDVVSRDNYVYRWTPRQLEALLESYYLDSGYRVDITRGWLSKQANAHAAGPVRRVAAVGGAIASHIPGAEGNLMVALIIPGGDQPPEPRSFSSADELDTGARTATRIPDLALDGESTAD